MFDQVYALSAILLLALAGLATSNFLYDLGVNTSLSRCVAAMLGGAAFLIGVVWLDVWMAVVLSGVLTLVIFVIRLGFRRGLRGVSGNLPAQAWAEITFPLAGTVSLAVGWGLLDDKWLAFVPIAFMAWGDNVAGFTRASIWRGREMSMWPSIAMLGVCLAAAALFQPYWIGALGAVVATAAERFGPAALSVWDDNLTIVAASLAVMGVLRLTWC